MFNTTQEKRELRDGKNLDQMLNMEYNLIPKQQNIVQKQEKELDLNNELRLQETLAKNLLKAENYPTGLINLIVEYLKIDNNLSQFVKYFNIFISALERQPKNIEEFQKQWSLFSQQRLGEKITPLDANLRKIANPEFFYTREQLVKMSTKQLDIIFREAVERKTGKTLEEVNQISYLGSNNKMTQPIKFSRDSSMDGSILFSKVNKANIVEESNRIKIIYILNVINPRLTYAEVNNRWVGEGVDLTLSTKTAFPSSIKNPLLDLPKGTGFKKKLGRTIFR